jgi:hypothetical protein
MKNRTKQIIYGIINAFKTDRLFKNIVIDFNNKAALTGMSSNFWEDVELLVNL